MKIKWKKLFDWRVAGVQRYLYNVVDEGFTYYVDVKYLHHGLRRVKFQTKPHATVAEQKSLRKEADAYFDKMHAKMQRDMKTR